MSAQRPPTLHLIVGLPGSGKTTLARRLEGELNALRFTPDEWIASLYGDGLTQAALDAARDPVEALQWRVASRALSLGLSVILDFGLWARLERRNAALPPATFRISREQLSTWWNLFEPPDSNELRTAYE